MATPGHADWERFLLQSRVKQALDIQVEQNEVANVVVNALMGPLLDGLAQDNRRYGPSSAGKNNKRSRQ